MKTSQFNRSGRQFFVASALLVVSFGLTSGVSLCKETDWNKELQKGYYEISNGNTEQAIAFFQGKVRKNATSGACHTGLGVALRRLGKIGEAKAEFKQATEVEPTFPEGFLEYGKVLEDEKDYENAAQAFEKYLQLKPDSGQRRAVSDRITYCRNQQQ